jgi:DBP10CT (NUC160) domain
MQLSKAITAVQSKRVDLKLKEMEKQQQTLGARQVEMDEEDLALFKTEDKPAKRQKVVGKDSEFYLSYRPQDADTEVGYAVHAGESTSNFAQNARQASMEIVADDPDDMKKKGDLRWDSTKHKFTRDTIGSDNKKRIRTENGTTVLASFKADRYIHITLVSSSGRKRQRQRCRELVRLSFKALERRHNKNANTDTIMSTSPTQRPNPLHVNCLRWKPDGEKRARRAKILRI